MKNPRLYPKSEKAGAAISHERQIFNREKPIFSLRFHHKHTLRFIAWQLCMLIKINIYR